MVRTLLHRAKSIVTEPEDKTNEIELVKLALKRCDIKIEF